MFDDPKKELEQLEEKLLAAEDDDWLDKQLSEAKALIGDAPRKKRPANGNAYRNYANSYGKEAPKTQAAPKKKEPQVYADEYEEEEEVPKEKGVRGLIILAVAETLGIVGIIAYWLIHLL